MGPADQPKREKRTVRETVNLRPSVAAAVVAICAHENRSKSTVIQRILEKDPTVQIFIQQVTGSEGRN